MFDRIFPKAWVVAIAGVLALAMGGAADHAAAEVVRYEAPEAPRIAALKEIPSLEAQVEAKTLPPVAERLP
ncbi:MAG: hypothetical protein RLN99_14910, partial [Kiloniellaceae bacterium]